MKSTKEVVSVKLSDDVELQLTGNYMPRQPGKMYMSNGDPGYPDEPAEFDIIEAEITKGTVLDLILQLDTGVVLDTLANRAIEKLDI